MPTQTVYGFRRAAFTNHMTKSSYPNTHQGMGVAKSFEDGDYVERDLPGRKDPLSSCSSRGPAPPEKRRPHSNSGFTQDRLAVQGQTSGNALLARTPHAGGSRVGIHFARRTGFS